jgi:XTP/dITP diphosphohydrolase
MMRFVTTNEGKFRELAHLLEGHGIHIERLDRDYPELQAETLEEVVRHALDVLGKSMDDVLVDDSGMFVEGLNGFPGVYSAHAYQTIGATGILHLLKGQTNRAARFETVLGLRRHGKSHFVTGTCKGTIAEKPRGRSGFGFDPIFVPAGHKKTLAEMSTEEKNGLSHRGNAARALVRLLSGG